LNINVSILTFICLKFIEFRTRKDEVCRSSFFDFNYFYIDCYLDLYVLMVIGALTQKMVLGFVKDRSFRKTP